MFRTNCLLVAFLFVSVSITSGPSNAADELKSVEARTLKLNVPQGWREVKTTSRFRAAQFEIPAKEAKADSAELVVYYFGGPTGGIKANVSRWIGQFHEKGRKTTLVRGKSKQGEYVLSEVSGTWKKPDGPPFARKTIDVPGSRVLGVILMQPQGDTTEYYFLKFAGPDKLVKSNAVALRTSFGGSAKSEKPLKLEDAEN